MWQTMPLTPADVHNGAFSKPPIGKRGYNEDEVDAFLNLVEARLTELIEENSDLRQRLAELDQALANGRSGAGTAATQQIPVYGAPRRRRARHLNRGTSRRRRRRKRPVSPKKGSTSGPPRCSRWRRTPPTG